jgi:hypothetical protein
MEVMKSLIITLILLTSFLSIDAQDSTKKNRKDNKDEKRAEQIKKVSELIESKTFVFNIRQAVPMCGDVVSLDYLYSVSLDKNIISSYMPFYGFESNYVIENSPLNFTKLCEDYSMIIEDNKYIITFNVPEESGNMKFYFRISELGYAYLKIYSKERQSIAFQGIIAEIEPTVLN